MQMSESATAATQSSEASRSVGFSFFSVPFYFLLFYFLVIELLTVSSSSSSSSRKKRKEKQKKNYDVLGGPQTTLLRALIEKREAPCFVFLAFESGRSRTRMDEKRQINSIEKQNKTASTLETDVPRYFETKRIIKKKKYQSGRVLGPRGFSREEMFVRLKRILDRSLLSDRLLPGFKGRGLS